ncbi:hypothetical protein ACTVPT_26370 [Serratia bockelmannii]|uniref:hypothetical protein n=1 Tax=Serratia TaxID=613 RepID=UPI00146D3956|nr:hypothetical protein [Serratia marcescens]NMT27222.1 hypothetical protein [Serratia marcescens]
MKINTINGSEVSELTVAIQFDEIAPRQFTWYLNHSHTRHKKGEDDENESNSYDRRQSTVGGSGNPHS